MYFKLKAPPHIPAIEMRDAFVEPISGQVCNRKVLRASFDNGQYILSAVHDRSVYNKDVYDREYLYILIDIDSHIWYMDLLKTYSGLEFSITLNGEYIYTRAIPPYNNIKIVHNSGLSIICLSWVV